MCYYTIANYCVCTSQKHCSNYCVLYIGMAIIGVIVLLYD